MSQKLFFLFIIFSCLVNDIIAQDPISINLINQKFEPVAFAVAKTADTVVFSNNQGQLKFHYPPKQIEIYALGYQNKTLTTFKYQVTLEKHNTPYNDAKGILNKVVENKKDNDPYDVFQPINFDRYNRIEIKRDSLENDSGNQNLFAERLSKFSIDDTHSKEFILAQKNQGFDKPVLKILSHRLHGLNWYNRSYVIFETDYASPLHQSNFKAYEYQLIHQDQNFYYIKFSPKLKQTDRLLQGVICIDKDFALAGIYVSKDDEIKLDLIQLYSKKTSQNIWLTDKVVLEMRPGSGGTPVSVFGTNIDIGTLQGKTVTKADINNRLFSTSIFYNYDFEDKELNTKSYDVLAQTDAHQRDNSYWDDKRKISLSKKDSLFFEGTAETLSKEHTIAKIKKLENVNDGFFPIFKWKTDLKTLIKINNYEGLRLGIGGLTNKDFSENFRVGGYVAYGTKDGATKFGVNTGFLLDRETNMWLNAEYTDDVREVGSNSYLTDERVYSLFEPRLVNIIFFYKEKTAAISLQKRLTPKLLSELKIAHDRINQTENYAYLNGDIALSSYNLSRGLLSLRWSPFSKFLKFDNNFKNIKENYPVISSQIEHYFGKTFGGDLSFTKLNLKGTYIFNHLNSQQTEFAIEGNYAFGDVPLTHSYHAFPNAPNKATILDRFSVAGVKSFETMFFSEFFSTRIASLHLKHRFAPFKISNKFRPEMVIISRHAIGDFSEQERHVGVDFNTLDKGYSEAGLELNKIFWGFGLSFAYRYGAYHLPVFEDNIAFKFTFNFEI